MVICPRCKGSFKHNGALKNHLKKTIKCEKVHEHKEDNETKNDTNTFETISKGTMVYFSNTQKYKCAFCNKEYSNKCSVYKHFKTCRAKKDRDKDKERITKLETELRVLKKYVEGIEKNPKSVTNYNTINIYKAGSGNFDILHHGEDFVFGKFSPDNRETPRSMHEDFKRGIVKTIKETFCNPKKPDQLSIYRSNPNPCTVSPIMIFDKESHQFEATTERCALKKLMKHLFKIHEELNIIDETVEKDYNSDRYLVISGRLVEIKQMIEDDEQFYKEFRNSPMTFEILEMLHKNVELLKKKCGIDVKIIESHCKEKIHQRYSRSELLDTLMEGY